MIICDNHLHRSHYKEYLVSLINQNVIDPADILTVDELLAALRRDGVEVSGKRLDETDYEYQTRLRQVSSVADITNALTTRTR